MRRTLTDRPQHWKIGASGNWLAGKACLAKHYRPEVEMPVCDQRAAAGREKARYCIDTW
jgi:hypothetical protein